MDEKTSTSITDVILETQEITMIKSEITRLSTEFYASLEAFKNRNKPEKEEEEDRINIVAHESIPIDSWKSSMKALPKLHTQIMHNENSKEAHSLVDSGAQSSIVSIVSIVSTNLDEF
jgi:hypothetical protein